jgi:hypothetical protein
LKHFDSVGFSKIDREANGVADKLANKGVKDYWRLKEEGKGKREGSGGEGVGEGEEGKKE